MAPKNKLAKAGIEPVRVEMIDKRGNRAIPLADQVPLWEAKGWIVVQPQQDAGTAESLETEIYNGHD